MKVTGSTLFAIALAGLALACSSGSGSGQPSAQAASSGKSGGAGTSGGHDDARSGEGSQGEDGGGGDSRVAIGLRIAPVPLSLDGKPVGKVGLGSYIVNAQGGCNDCHTSPPYAPGGDPFLGEKMQINTEAYLAGGAPFGPGITSRNLTPDSSGKPAGLTLDEFIQVLRTGIDPEDGELLQVMPWPVYGQMSDHDLEAVYWYLSAIPHAEPPAAP